MRGQHGPALAALERARELGLPQLCYFEGRARIALGQGELEPAEHWLSRLLEKRPFDIDALEARGRVRAVRADYVQAAQDYAALRSLAPRVEYDRALARIYMSKEELPQAKALLMGSLQRAPKDAELHGLMGHLAIMEKRWADGEKELRAALSLNDSLAEPTIDLALAMLQQGQDGMEFFLRKAKALAPESDPEGIFLRACDELSNAIADMVRWQKAARGARALAEVNPKLRAAHAVVLKANIARRDWQPLLEGAIRCLAAFPNDADALAAKKMAIKNGAKEGSFGSEPGAVPPPKQPK
jgi:Flp pilus assembly protein TadD